MVYTFMNYDDFNSKYNGIARVVNSYFNDMTNEEYADFGVKNCEILRYDF